ncbi:MAG: hypothetical protein NC920_00315 [Candidatus Omnitrophica bacterium]|nr:hypothetical protein [Candidatus Omnitrophota bacterium]MCM8797988.1 hypothetical protein [Candidatus Omnitrophota bacterium]
MGRIYLGKRTDIPRIFFFAILITILVYFISLKEKEKKLRISLQEKLNNVLSEKIVKEEELNKANAEKIILEETVNNLKLKIESLSTELDKEKASGLELSEKLKARESEVERLNSELNKLKREKETLENKIKEAEAKIKNLELTLVQLQTIKTELERKLDNIMSKRLEVELEKVVIKRPASGRVGRILAVNHPYEFVVIDLGKEQGIEMGTLLGVYQGEEMIARIKVEKVYENMSVADIVYEKEKGVIRDEDLVKFIHSESVE